MIIEKSAGGIIINDGKILLVYQNSTKSWEFPKGHIDDGETAEEAAKREIYEETGIKKLDFMKELGTYFRESKKSGNVKKQITLFQFLTKEKKLSSHDKENPEAKWVPIEEVSEILTYDKTRNFFLKIKDSLTEQVA